MTADDLTIQHEETAAGGAFFIEQNAKRLAELAYRRVDGKLVDIKHTEVKEELRGRGVARLLLDRAVAWARESGTRVAATCPYAKAQFEKDASIRDVYAA